MKLDDEHEEAWLQELHAVLVKCRDDVEASQQLLLMGQEHAEASFEAEQQVRRLFSGVVMQIQPLTELLPGCRFVFGEDMIQCLFPNQSTATLRLHRMGNTPVLCAEYPLTHRSRAIALPDLPLLAFPSAPEGFLGMATTTIDVLKPGRKQTTWNPTPVDVAALAGRRLRTLLRAAVSEFMIIVAGHLPSCR